MQAGTALVRLCGCTGSPEPSLLAYTISTEISCADRITAVYKILYMCMFYFAVGMNVILRYLFVKNLLILKKTPPTARWYKLNLAGLVLGVLSAFGLSMVANFQVNYNTRSCDLYGPRYDKRYLMDISIKI